MPTTSRTWLILLAAASALALVFAYALHYLGGFLPCQLCYWQRYPYMAVLVVAGLGVASGFNRLALAVAGGLFLVGAGIAAYHVGVEQGLFALPAGCVSAGSATTVAELRAQLASAAPACAQGRVACMGLSLSAWNALAALALAALSLLGLGLARRSYLAAA